MGEFDIYIRSFAPKRAGATVEGLERLFGLTAFQARELIHSVPRVIKRRVPGKQLARYERALAELGAVYEIRPCAISPAQIIAVQSDEAPSREDTGGTLELPGVRQPGASPPPPASAVTTSSEPPASDISDKTEVDVHPASAESMSDTIPQRAVDVPGAGTNQTLHQYDAEGAPPPSVPPSAAGGPTVRSYRTLGAAPAPAGPSVPPAPVTSEPTTRQQPTPVARPRPVARPAEPTTPDAAAVSASAPPPAMGVEPAVPEPAAPLAPEPTAPVVPDPAAPAVVEAAPSSAWASLQPTPAPDGVQASVTPSMVWAALEPPAEEPAPTPSPAASAQEAPADGALPPAAEVPGLDASGAAEWMHNEGLATQSAAADGSDPEALELATPEHPGPAASRGRVLGLPGAPADAPSSGRQLSLPGSPATSPVTRERPSEGNELPLSRAVFAVTGSRRRSAMGMRAVDGGEDVPPLMRVGIRLLLGTTFFLALMLVRHCEPLGSDVDRELARWDRQDFGTGARRPALDWMRVGSHQFVVVDKDQVAGMVGELKGAGAVEVYTTDIVRSGMVFIARALLIELPKGQSERDEVFEVANRYLGALGPLEDLGQSTIKLSL